MSRAGGPMSVYREGLDPHRPDGYTDLMDIDRRRLALNQERDVDQARFAARCEAQHGRGGADDPVSTRRQVTRTRHGLRLTRDEAGIWWTDDRSNGLIRVSAYTFCEGPHPVRITLAMRRGVLEHPGNPLTRAAEEAVRAGRAGYYCRGGVEHHQPSIGWEVLDTDRAGDDLHESMDSAWLALAVALGTV